MLGAAASALPLARTRPLPGRKADMLSCEVCLMGSAKTWLWRFAARVRNESEMRGRAASCLWFWRQRVAASRVLYSRKVVNRDSEHYCATLYTVVFGSEQSDTAVYFDEISVRP